MTDLDPRALRLEPELASAGRARRLVGDAVAAWDLLELAADATLCMTELAANAVLHCRRPFTATVRRTSDGVIVEVIDACPAVLPVSVPASGSAVDLTTASATGRGLRIISTVAQRWGVASSQHTKSVWAELSTGLGVGRAEPVLELAHVLPRADHAVSLRFRSLPVRAAVASGIHVDDLVRKIQLRALHGGPSAEQLFGLLDRSAPVRLGGRHGALGAAGEGRRRFDLDLTATLEALTATGELGRLLERSADWTRAAPIPPAVLGFRRWLDDESDRQCAGHPPSRCPLPS